MNITPLQRARYAYLPKLPPVLRGDLSHIRAVEGNATAAAADAEKIQSLFPALFGSPTVTFQSGEGTVPAKIHRVGVILSGGQAPGGHNVVSGLFDALKKANPENTLFGFRNGAGGLVEDNCFAIEKEYVDLFRNTGGFDMIGSGRTKIETPEQFAAAARTCEKHQLTAVVIIGGDDSNTNAAMLAEYFAENQIDVQVIGCPKTIDGDLKNEDIEISFGFDTATKTYSELIGNIARDTISAKKYWYFIKVMGRSASHIALECALKTHPNVTLISEEIAAEERSLTEIASSIADVVATRAKAGKNYGIVLIPEGVVEFIPEFSTLIRACNDLLSGENEAAYAKLSDWSEQLAFIEKHLPEESRKVFSILPEFIQKQLFLERDPHGNVQVSRIDSEALLSSLVTKELADRKKNGTYSGKFSPTKAFFGFEGRSVMPSNFDADYCYSLGYNAFLLIQYGYNGYMSRISNVFRPADEWVAGGMPITKMMNMEHRHGEDKPVIQKALVELDGKPFAELERNREDWAYGDEYAYPGAIQYFGPDEVCNDITMTLRLEHE